MPIEQNKQKAKKVYKKPKLRKIELAADEVMGIGCKLSDGGFSLDAAPCNINNCSTIDTS